MKTELFGFGAVAAALIGGLLLAKSVGFGGAEPGQDPAAQLGHAMVGAIVVEQAWAAETIGDQGRTAAYMTIQNGSGGEERLMVAHVEGAARTSIHRTVTEDNITRMDHINALIIQPEGSAHLSPGGTHIMIMGLEGPLAAGDSVTLSLGFLEAGDVTFEVPVRARMDMMDHSGH